MIESSLSPLIGTCVGSYEITAKLGEGGMGVAFEVRDLHLGRGVALEALPESLASDATATIDAWRYDSSR